VLGAAVVELELIVVVMVQPLVLQQYQMEEQPQGVVVALQIHQV